MDTGVTVVEFVRLSFLIFFREADLHFGGFLKAIITKVRSSLRDFVPRIDQSSKEQDKYT